MDKDKLSLLCTSLLKWTPLHLKKFMGQHSGDFDAALKTILSWNSANTAMHVPMEVFEIHRMQFVHLQKVRMLEPWAGSCGPAQAFLSEASLFEITITLEINPFYPMCAFKVPYAMCMKLATFMQIRITPQVHVYAIMCRELMERPIVPVEEMQVVLQYAGISTLPYLEKLFPFGGGVLMGHALEFVDVDLTPQAHMYREVPHKSELIGKVREKRNLEVRIVRIGNDYMWRSNATEFVRIVKSMNKPVLPLS